MALTVNQPAKSVLVEGDRAWSLALALSEGAAAVGSPIGRLLADARGRADVMRCARSLGEKHLATHPRDTRRALRALDLVDDALDRIERS